MWAGLAIGAAWAFTRSGTVWTQQGSKLVGTGAVGIADQGWAVALSADGNTAIVGGFGDNSYTGAAWVYIRSGGVWTQQGSKLVGIAAVAAAPPPMPRIASKLPPDQIQALASYLSFVR